MGSLGEYLEKTKLVLSLKDKDSIDTSWIQEEEKVLSIEKIQEKEPMKSIDVYFIYINQNKYIQKTIYEEHALSKNGENRHYISKKDILQMIQTKKQKTNCSKYVFQEMILFNIDTDNDKLPEFIESPQENENPLQFIQKITTVQDIEIPESIFVFHDVNSLFIFFQEIDIVNSSHNHTMKTILKRKHNITRREDNEHEIQCEPHHNRTAKNVQIQVSKIQKKNKTAKITLNDTEPNVA